MCAPLGNCLVHTHILHVYKLYMMHVIRGVARIWERGVLNEWMVQITSARSALAAHHRCAPMGGLGALPQKIFFITCSEIDYNVIWLKK